MQKIGSVTTTADANGEWTNGNVASGTPPTILDAAWLNTVQRELANIVTSGGLTLDPNNDAQVLLALKSIMGAGRLINTRYITSSTTYTPTPGTRFIYVYIQGAGGAGGGSQATTGTNSAAGAGGNSGHLAVYQFTSGFSNVLVTIGSGGIGGVSSNGATGGTTSFGTLGNAPGGGGGNFGLAKSSGVTAYSVTGASYIGTPMRVKNSQAGVPGNVYSSGNALGGAGGSCDFGNGAGYGAGANANPGQDYGAGGAGSAGSFNASAFAGGNGANGIVMIQEYS